MWPAKTKVLWLLQKHISGITEFFLESAHCSELRRYRLTKGQVHRPPCIYEHCHTHDIHQHLRWPAPLLDYGTTQRPAEEGKKKNRNPAIGSHLGRPTDKTGPLSLFKPSLSQTESQRTISMPIQLYTFCLAF